MKIFGYLKNTFEPAYSKMGNILTNHPTMMILVLLLFCGVSVIFPSKVNLVLLTIVSIIFIVGVGSLFLNDEKEFSHKVGLWLGVGATFSVTILFGCVYSFLLIGNNYYEHFSFSEDSMPGKAVTKKLSYQLLERTEFLTNEYGQAFDLKPSKTWTSECENSTSNDNEIDLNILNKAKQNKSFVTGAMATAYRKIYSDASMRSYFGSISEYEYAVPYNYMNILKQFASRQIRSNFIPLDSWSVLKKDPKKLDEAVLFLLGDEVKPVIRYAAAIFIKNHITFCMSTKEIELRMGKLPPGMTSMFASVIPELFFERFGLTDSKKNVNRELVFSSMLFSSMSIMTSGYSDMIPKSTISRICLVAQFFSYVVIILMIVPIGIERPRGKQ